MEDPPGRRVGVSPLEDRVPPPTPGGGMGDASAPTVPGWSPPARAAPSEPGVSPAVVLVSLVPLGLVLLLAVIAPSFLAPLLDPRATLFGLPAITGFLGALALLFALDLLVAWAVPSRVVVGLVVAATTVIGLFMVILAPSLILIMINLQDLPD